MHIYVDVIQCYDNQKPYQMIFFVLKLGTGYYTYL